MHTGTDSFSMSSLEFWTGMGIFAMNFEKCPGASGHTGVNARSGSQLTINLKNCHNALMLHCVLHIVCGLNVSAAGCEVLD